MRKDTLPIGDTLVQQSLRQSLVQFVYLTLVLAVVIFGGAGVLNHAWGG